MDGTRKKSGRRTGMEEWGIYRSGFKHSNKNRRKEEGSQARCFYRREGGRSGNGDRYVSPFWLSSEKQGEARRETGSKEEQQETWGTQNTGFVMVLLANSRVEWEVLKTKWALNVKVNHVTLQINIKQGHRLRFPLIKPCQSLRTSDQMQAVKHHLQRTMLLCGQRTVARLFNRSQLPGQISTSCLTKRP